MNYPPIQTETHLQLHPDIWSLAIFGGAGLFVFLFFTIPLLRGYLTGRGVIGRYRGKGNGGVVLRVRPKNFPASDYSKNSFMAETTYFSPQKCLLYAVISFILAACIAGVAFLNIRSV